jgi:hypothetical protein
MTVRPHSILARGFIRSLLGLYPREFRATYGAEMRSDFLETLATRPCRRAKLRFLALPPLTPFAAPPPSTPRPGASHPCPPFHHPGATP